jgi:cation diffusion facilitator CzcD-associated flavoprotein CzcO
VSVTDVIVLGAGFGGLGMAAQLVRAGIDDFTVFEQADDLGGVWRTNVYPGAGCDTEAHLYCYSFAPHLRVSRMYAGREELQGYLNRFADEFDLRRHIHFGTRVVSAVWNDDAALWVIRTADGEEHRARFFLPAWGQLGTPSIPDFPGLADFAGAAFHSADWRQDLDLTGKRVISVGNAASAVQYVPEVAKIAAHLTVLQRSANWIMPRNQIVFSPQQLDAYEADPALFEQSRKDLHEFRENGFRRTRVGTAEQASGMTLALDHLQNQVQNAQLRAKLTPTYEFGCKRILRSDDYFPALTRDNVELVTTAVDRFVPQGVRTVDGVVHDADVIVFGTGFHSQAFQGELSVIGRGGVDLDERWLDGAEAYLGMTVDGFPNMFMIYGPNTNLNHNTIIAMLETQQDYIVEILQALLPRANASLDVRRNVLDDFNAHVQEQMKASAFAADCSSWYKDASGKVINNWSGTVDEYRAFAANWNPDDFVVAGAS